MNAAVSHANVHVVRNSFLKTGISNHLDRSEDNYLWNKCGKEEGEKEDVDEYILPLRDTDKDVPQEQWEELFVNSDEDENDFEGF